MADPFADIPTVRRDPFADIPSVSVSDPFADIPQTKPLTQEERQRRGQGLRSRLELQRLRSETDPSKTDTSKVIPRFGAGLIEGVPSNFQEMGAETGIQALSFPDRVRRSIAGGLEAFRSIPGAGRLADLVRPDRPEMKATKSTDNLWKFYRANKESNPQLAEKFRQRALEIDQENEFTKQINKDTADPIQRGIIELRKISESAAENVKLAQQHGQQIGGGVEGDIAEALGTTAGISAPSIVAAPAGGVAASAAVSGLISGGMMAAEAKRHLMEQGVSEEEAERRALGPSVIAGTITSAITRGFGASGVEALSEKQVYQGIRHAVKSVVRNFMAEAAEESIDETAQIATRAISFDPDILNRPDELSMTIGMAALSGGLLGGGVGVVGQTSGTARQLLERVSDEIAINKEEANLDAWAERYSDAIANLMTDPELSPGATPLQRITEEVAQVVTGNLVDTTAADPTTETRSFSPADEDVEAARLAQNTKRRSRMIDDLPDREFVEPRQPERTFVALERPGIIPVERNIRESVRKPEPEQTLEDRVAQLQGKPGFLLTAEEKLLKQQLEEQQAQPEQELAPQSTTTEAQAAPMADVQPQSQPTTATQQLTPEERIAVQRELAEQLGFTEEDSEAEAVAIQEDAPSDVAQPKTFVVESGEVVEAPNIGAELTARLERALDKIGGMTETEKTAALAELTARVSAANSNELRRRINQANLESVAAPEQPTIEDDARHTTQISETPFDMDVDIPGESSDRIRKRGATTVFREFEDDFNPRLNSDINLLSQYLSRNARAEALAEGDVDGGKQSRRSSVSQIVVSEIGPDGQRVARVFTALPKAPSQIKKGGTSVNIVVDPKAQKAIRYQPGYTADLKDFLREKGKKRRLIGAFKTRRKYQYYTLPGTNRNRLSESELANLLTTGRDFLRSNKAYQDEFDARQRLAHDDLETSRGEHASYNHETGEITLDDLRSLADDLPLAMSGVSGIQQDLRRDFEARSDIGILMRNPLWSGIASMFWDSLEAMRIFESVKLRKMSPNDAITDILTNPDSAAKELADVFGKSGSMQQRGQFARFVMAVRNAFSQNPQSREDFLDIMRGDLRGEYPKIESPSQDEHEAAEIKAAEPYDLANNIASTEGFARTMWDAYRFALMSRVRPGLTEEEFLQIPAETLLTVNKQTGEQRAVPAIPSRAVVGEDPDVVAVIARYQPASGLFSATLDTATEGRMREVAPALVAGLKTAIAGARNYEAFKANLRGGVSAFSDDVFIEPPTAESTEQIRARRLDAFDRAIEIANTTARGGNDPLARLYRWADRASKKPGVAALGLDKMAATTIKVIMDIAASGPSKDFQTWLTTMNDTSREAVNRFHQTMVAINPDLSWDQAAEAVYGEATRVLEQPLSVAASKFLYISNAEEAARAVYQVTDEFMRGRVSEIILASANLIPDQYKKLILDLEAADAEVEEGEEAPEKAEWLGETSEQERKHLKRNLSPVASALSVEQMMGEIDPDLKAINFIDLPDDQQGIMAQSFLLKYAQLRKRFRNLVENQASHIEALQKLMLEETATEVRTMNVLDAVGKDIVRQFGFYIKGSVAKQKAESERTGIEKTSASRLASAVGQLREASAVGTLLEAVAQNAPEEVLRGTARRVADWIKGWDGKNAFVSDEITDALLLEEDGQSAISSYEDLPKVLRWIKTASGKESQIESERQAIQEWLSANNPKKKGFKKWMEEYRKLMNRSAMIRSAIMAKKRQARRLVERINAEDKSIGILQALLNDPEFGAKVDAAAEITDTSLNEVITMSERNALVDIKNPKNPANVHQISYLPGKHVDNGLEISQLISDIEEYLASPEDFDPVKDVAKERAYRKTLNLLKVHWKHAEATMRGGLAPDGVIRFKIPKKIPGVGGTSFSLFGAGKHLAVFTTNERQFVRRIAGLWGQALANILDRRDDMEKEHAKINAHPVYGLPKQQVALYEAAESHGIDTSHNYPLFDTYVEQVLEPIVASQQTINSDPIEVGDVINGFTVNEKDMKYIRLVQQWESAIRRDAQNNPGDSNIKQLQAIEIMDGSWKRKAVGVDTTMPVRLNGDMIHWVQTTWNNTKGKEGRMALLDGSDEEIFRRVVMGYVSNRNRLFLRKSPYTPQYRALTHAWAKGKETPQTWDELVEQIATASKGNLIANMNAISDQLYTEIEKVVNDFQSEVNSGDGDFRSYMIENAISGLASDKEVAAAYKKMTRKMSDPNMKEAVGHLVSSHNQYTKPRGKLVAPSTFYNYVPADSGSLSMIQFGARQVLNLRLIRALYMVRNAVNSRLADHEKALREIKSRRDKARYRTSTISREMGKERDNYYQLDKWRNHLNYILGNTLHNVIGEMSDIGSPARHLWANLRGQGVGSILSSAMALVRNVSAMFGAAAAMADQLAGRTRRAPLTPWMRLLSGSRIVPAAFLNKAAEEMPRFRQFIKSNRKALNLMFFGMANMIDVYAEAKANAIAANIVTPTNVMDKAKARRKARGRGGVNFKEEIPWLVAAANHIMDMPFIAEAAEAWTAYNPNAAFDRMSNTFNYNYYNSILEDHIKLNMLTALQSREKSGSKIDYDMEPLTAKEMGYRHERLLSETRLFLQSAGTLEAIAVDLWKRFKAADRDGDKVRLFENKKNQDAVIQDIAKVVGGTSFESTRFQPSKGGGTEGLIRRELFTFWGWPTNWLSSITKIVTNAWSNEQDISSKRKAAWVAAMAMGTLVPLFFSFLAFGSIAQQEPGNLIRDIVFNDPPTSPRLGNVLKSIDDPKKIAQYTAVSAANLFPYVGSAVASLLDVDSVRSIRIRDLASSVPLLNFMSDFEDAARAVWQTGDLWMPTATFVKRWAPSPVGFAMNYTSNLVGGEVLSRGPARAIRASAPTDFEMRLRGGAGGPIRRTRFSGIMRRMLASAYAGDVGDSRKYYRMAINELRKQGRENPERVVAQSLTARSPVRSAVGRTLTPQEERAIVSRMTGSQRNRYEQGKKAYRLLSRVVGKEIRFGTEKSRL